MNNAVIVSEKATELIKLLEEHGFTVITHRKNASVDERIADHPDLSYFFDGNDTLFLCQDFSADIYKFRPFVKNVIVIDEKLGKNYPDDVKLNCVVLGRFFICNKKTVSRTILEHMINKDFAVVDVKQGYTKCSVLPIGDNAVITDDFSIADKCAQAGIDFLLVEKGDVCLNGFDYGFIGGCAGLIGDDTVCFNGDITLHRNFDKIQKFLISKNINYICSDNLLEDTGSILPLYNTQE